MQATLVHIEGMGNFSLCAQALFAALWRCAVCRSKHPHAGTETDGLLAHAAAFPCFTCSVPDVLLYCRYPRLPCSLCAEQDASLSQDGAVKKCMVDQADSLSDGCRRELGRSLYMAFFVWQPQGLLTAPCDADVQRLCLSRVKDMDAMPGAVEVCLSEIVSVPRMRGVGLADHNTCTHSSRQV